MKRAFHLVVGALAMLIVALSSAFLSMRLAIHGREVAVPDLSRLSIAEAGDLAASRGLRLSLEDRFYSATVPSGRVLAQSPPPGAKVRHDWTIRIAESLGPQQVSVPNLLGQPERPATISLRRIGLETGTIAHLPTGAPPGTLIAQSPLPGGEAVERPSISLLVSDPDAAQSSEAIVMPALNGLTLRAASARAAAAGLHIVSAEDIITSAPRDAPASPARSSGPLASSVGSATVVAQTPAGGFRVLKGAPVHITLAH